ncbi:MAG: energy-coupled thiamine transporter ThiT [Candidatus Bathyarchaeota archaeon]|nr:energy-coupled thiamine transporter ThiT [Candidatus Termiticorpusculum sp.]
MENVKNNNPNPKIKSRINAQILAEIAIFVALSTALSLIPGIGFPQGGSVTAGTMVPILWLAMRRGPKIGIFTGIIYGLVQLAIHPQVYYPTQILLDYPLAFGCIGLAGFFKNHPITGTTIAIIGRFIMHLISGAIFFGQYAPKGMNPLVYSILYNGSYMLPELIISIIIIYLLHKTNVLKIYT